MGLEFDDSSAPQEKRMQEAKMETANVSFDILC
jgi:hypothetical protein